MKNDDFKDMWNDMQKDGYFSNHPHYTDFHGQKPSNEDIALDAQFMALDFTGRNISMPIPYSDVLERSIKRTESVWLYRMFDLPKSGNALDIGCGFGRSIRWMAERYDNVIGTDISEFVIAEAKSNYKHLENVSFHVNGSDSLPESIGPGSIDVAYIFTVFQHIPREYTAMLLRDVSRVLKPGGKAVFNLLSNVNEDVVEGEQFTEWAIGYSETQAIALLKDSGLKEERVVSWTRPETEVSWLWVSAVKQ